MADIATYKIQFKSDFVLTIHGDAGWTTPFCIKFWTGDPSRGYFVGWDGQNYTNCKVDNTDTSRLIVLFDDHRLQVGQLKMQMAWHTTIADFPKVRFDEVMNQMNVVATVDGEDKYIELAFDGEADPEVEYFLPAYANEAQRIANEQERVREFAQMQEENAQAVEGAENVNATLNGTILTVINREGQSTSVNTKGEAGQGVPAGGLTGQMLFKKSDADYDTDWQDPHEAGVNSVNGKTGYVTLNASDVGALPSDTHIPTVPTNVSAFINDAGYITKTVNDLVNYYLKSDTYTKTEVQQLIAAIQQFVYQVASSLPTASSDTMNKIYLVPSADPQTQNVKDEYITIDNGASATTRYIWEQIGSTAIDLSGYYTSQQTDAAITTALNTALADYTTTSALTLLLAAKQDVISDLATIRSGAAAGATAYQKPQTGIPSTDMSSDVQTSLTKANTALQSQVQANWNETDTDDASFIKNKPTIPTALSQLSEDSTHRTVSDTEKTAWNNKQDALVSGQSIKTINNESVLGGGNISVVTELPSNLAYTSNDSGVGIVPEDGIRAETVTSAAAMTINPDVVTVINGAVGTAAITLQVPNDNLAHVWDILLTTDSSVAITFAMSNSATILYPSGFSIGASKAVEISVIGVGTKYYLRYGEFA